jgi:hypothetical protein
MRSRRKISSHSHGRASRGPELRHCARHPKKFREHIQSSILIFRSSPYISHNVVIEIIGALGAANSLTPCHCFSEDTSCLWHQSRAINCSICSSILDVFRTKTRCAFGLPICWRILLMEYRHRRACCEACIRIRDRAQFERRGGRLQHQRQGVSGRQPIPSMITPAIATCQSSN